MAIYIYIYIYLSWRERLECNKFVCVLHIPASCWICIYIIWGEREREEREREREREGLV